MVEFKLSNPSAEVVSLAAREMVKCGLSIGASVTLLLECDDVDVMSQNCGTININHQLKDGIHSYKNVQIECIKIKRDKLILVCSFESQLFE